jgi:hypothetical protein
MRIVTMGNPNVVKCQRMEIAFDQSLKAALNANDFRLHAVAIRPRS